MPYDLYEERDVTVEEWNENRQEHYRLIQQLQSGKIKLLCNKCRFEVEDQKHHDHSVSPSRIQVICKSTRCGYVDYRYG